MNWKKGLLIGAAMMGSLLMAGCGSDAKFGTIDMNRVWNESEKLQTIQAEYTAKAQDLTTKLQQEQAALPADQFQQKQQEAYQELSQIKRELGAQLETTMKTAADQVAQDKGLSLILVKESVAQGGIDVTDDVINKLK